MGASNAYPAIVQALRDTLLSVDGMPGPEHRAWANRLFTVPDPPAPWVRYTFNPGSLDIASLGPLATMRAEGVFLVDWFFPAGGGLNEPLVMGGRVLDAFNPRVVCLAEGQPVTIRRSYMTQPIVDGAWVHVPVTVEWRADFESPV